jgi:hypothetical protein
MTMTTEELMTDGRQQLMLCPWIATQRFNEH